VFSALGHHSFTVHLVVMCNAVLGLRAMFGFVADVQISASHFYSEHNTDIKI
jgi:hypothetical protein